MGSWCTNMQQRAGNGISRAATGIYLPKVCKSRWDLGVLAPCAGPSVLGIDVLLLSPGLLFCLFCENASGPGHGFPGPPTA